MIKLLQKIYAEILHMISLALLGPEKDKKMVKLKEVQVVNQKPKFESKKTEQFFKNVEKETIATSMDLVAETTHEDRILRMLNLILDQVLIQTYKASENTELNLIHPEFAPYILTSGAAMASEKTEEKIQRLAKEKDRRYALLYTQEALSAQWRKSYAVLISEAGKYETLANGYSQLRARLKELWRQSIWADAKYSDEFLVKHLISEPELEEFLFALANDGFEFMLSTDTDTKKREEQTR